MLLQPIYNYNADRPNRWGLLDPQSGSVYEFPKQKIHRYQHFTETAEATFRDIRPSFENDAHFSMIRDTNIGFLTTFHKYSYERGKYLRVLNDPTNYVTTLATDYSTAIEQSENRIGNYRLGARRNIIHLGGTINEEQLDDLSSVTKDDFHPTTSISFPFFPPVPSNIEKAPRVLLTASDSGYVDYIVSKHPTDTTQDAWRSEQGSGFRRFVFAQGNLTSSASATNLDDRKPEIEDIETVLDSAIDTATSSDFTSFTPADGEDVTINIPGQHVLTSSSTGWKIELFGDGFGSAATADIVIDKATGDVTIDSGNHQINMDNDGDLTLTDGTRTITMNGSTVDIT